MDRKQWKSRYHTPLWKGVNLLLSIFVMLSTFSAMIRDSESVTAWKARQFMFLENSTETDVIEESGGPKETAETYSPSPEEVLPQISSSAEGSSISDINENGSEETEVIPDNGPSAVPVLYPYHIYTNETENSDEQPDIIITAEAPEGALPEGTEMIVSVLEADQEILDEVEHQTEGTVKYVQAVDISFVYKGVEIEPLIPVRISMKSDVIREAAEDTAVNTELYHLKEETDQTVTEKIEHTGAESEETEENEITFESESFSVYVFVGMEVITERYITSEGDNYTITVTFEKDSGIPDDAELDVREIKEESEEYKHYLSMSENTLGIENGRAHIFDISIVSEDHSSRYQPSEGKTVNVKIELEDAAEKDISVIHFSEEPEIIENTAEDGTVTFEASGFSVYAIVERTIEDNVLTKDGHNYKVSVTYGPETGIPENAELIAEEITEGTEIYNTYVSNTENALGWNEGETGYIRLFDIKITDPYDHGIKYQPAEGTAVDVKIELADSENEELNVVHFSDGNTEGNIIESVTEGQTVSFKADGFSVYALADKGPIRTYSFYSLNADGAYEKYYFMTDTGESVYQQKIKTVDGVTESLVIPQLPAIPGSTTSTFAGWYTYDPNTGTYSDEPFDFSDIPEVTEEEEIILRAKFADYAYVIFHEQYNGSTRTWPIAETRRGEKTDGSTTVQISDVTVTYDDSEAEENSAPEMAFRGWSLTKVDAGSKTDIDGNPVQLVSDPITITENTDLYPVFVPINWLTFSSGQTGSGATYVPPRYYYTDEGESNFPIPVRTGYTFDGWYTAEEGGTRIVNADGSIAITDTVEDFSVVNDELRISDDTTLYGHWTEANTKYTVVIWRQKATDDVNLSDSEKHYDFAESFTLDALTGSQVNVPNAYRNLAGSGDYTGFHYDRCDDTKTAAGNGSTVLNVYYDRNVHTLTFRTNNRTRRSITALFGASIKGYFPIVGTNGYTYAGYVWEDNGNPKVYPFVLSTIETMPDEDVIFNGSSGGTNKTIYYYVEVDSQSESDGTTFDGKYYTLYKTVQHNYNFITYDEEYHPITGYVRDYENADPAFYYSQARGGYTANSNSGVNYLYYDRDTFNITFTDSYTNQNVTVNGSEVTPVSVKYNQKLSGFIPEDPTSSREGYRFTGWYADSACSTRVYFDEEEYNNSTAESKVLYERMPANNLQLFAGWETEWYLIEMDPNGGELSDTQSTWFWEPYNGEPIEEYSTAARNYQESLNGTWYYAVQDREYYGLSDEWDNIEDTISARKAYYTQDVSDPAADLSKKYEKSQDAYRYAGWYEVHEDGSETLYAFGQPVMHNTKLRLHWKQLGTYYIRYDAGEGKLDNQDNNEEIFHTLDDADYADHAYIVVPRTAEAPEGKSFIGWTIRGGDGTIYYPGQTFEFQSLYSVTESVEGIEKEYLILDAVYSVIESAEIIYDANGGTVDTESVNYGAPADPDAYYRSEADETSATISGLLNNSEVKLSTGDGFALEGAVFTGWNTEPDASGEHFNAGDNYYVDKEEPVTLYAEWQVKVYFDKNNVNADWGGNWDAVDEDRNPIYTWDETRQQYYTYVYVNGTVDEPIYVPVSSQDDERFAYWSPVRYTDSGEVAYEYDFSTPVAGELTLYGFWANAIQIPYHVVDASNETLEEVNSWKKEGQDYFAVNTGTEIPLENKIDTETYVNIPNGYAYAFACVSDSLENCSEDNIVTEIGYNTVTKRVRVTYADGTEEDLPSDKEIYLVYFEDPKELAIDYKLMETDGTLTDVNVSDAAPISATAGTYNMTADVINPRSWANNQYQYYSFAIGDKNAGTGSQLHMVSSSSGSDNSRPDLQIRNTWRGYQYSTDGGNTWTNYGYDPELYVIYYESEPTIVTVKEHTIGTQADMDEEFEYDVVITTITTETISQEQRSRRWINGWFGSGRWGDWEDYSSYGTPQISSETESTSTSFALSDNELKDFTLFYTRNSSSTETPVDDSHTSGQNIQYQYRTTTTTTVTQTITVTQRPKNGFTTRNDSTGESHVYTYTTTSSDDDQEVTYTNTRTEEDIELHIALAQNGGFSSHDDKRTADESVYMISVPNGETVNLSEDNPDGLFTGDTDIYRFAGIIYGKEDEQGNITAYYTDVNSVSFKKLEDSEYLGVYMNDDPAKLIEEGYSIYYVYYPMPKIVYTKEGANGSLTVIDPIRRNENSVTLNGVTVAQNAQLEVGTDAFVIDQSVIGGFRVPPDLDGLNILSLNYAKIGTGKAGQEKISGLDAVSDAAGLQLKVVDGQVKYSFDGTEWNPFIGEEPTVYVIYKEKGYDLTITKTVKGSETEGEFELTITSPAITETGYSISGYEIEQDGEIIPVETIDAVPAKGETPGVITLTVKHGSKITISALQHGSYTIAEPELTEYEMSASVGGYPAAVTDNSTTFVLSNDTAAAITNTPVTLPVKIMKVNEGTTPLANAVFSLYTEEEYKKDEDTRKAMLNDLVSGDGTAVPLGEIDLDELQIGTYYLVETDAPDGYILLEKPVIITVESDRVYATVGSDSTAPNIAVKNEEDEWIVTVHNNPGVALPSTGGSGTANIYLLGIMMIVLSGAGLMIQKRRRKLYE